MPNWEALADIDVEVLVRDLLSAEWQTHVESFRRGPDGGVDLRASGPTGPPLNLPPRSQVIAQVKHYPNATLSRLRAAFKEEVRRGLHVNTRYIVVTTARLSLNTKRSISNLFDPPLRGSDVYGREDLEALLTRHEAVERRHLRLWLTDTVVLQAVLHTRERLLQDQVTQQIHKQGPLLVPTRQLVIAKDLLESEGAVIIAGPPGAGKTSAALLLLAEHMKSGWEILVAGDSLDDAERLWNKRTRQIIYYDDFLGSSLQTAFLTGKNEDRRIVGLLEHAATHEDLRIVLTTREYVLAAARRIHPRLAEERVDLTRVIVDAGALSAVERAEIIYRHVYFSDCRQVLLDKEVTPDDWVAVLRHRTFSPRLVRLYVQAFSREITNGVSVPRALDFVLGLKDALDDPSELWRSIYEDHLSARQRLLLQTCASVPTGLVLEDLLSLAFEWMDFSDRDDRDTLWAEWRGDLRTLNGDFLTFAPWGTGHLVGFANASINTYVLFRLASDFSAMLSLLEHAVLFEQVEQIWRIAGIHFERLHSVSDFGQGLTEAWMEEQEHEIFGSVPLLIIADHDLQRLQQAFKGAILRTFRVGIYQIHPAYGATPNRWTRMPSMIDAKTSRIYAMAETLGLADDDELASTVMDALLQYMSEGRGTGYAVLEAVRVFYSAANNAWSRRKSLIGDAAEEYFLGSGLIDGENFLDAINYLSTVGGASRIPELGPKIKQAVSKYLATEIAAHVVWPASGFRYSYADYNKVVEEIVSDFASAAEKIGIDIAAQLSELKDQLLQLAERQQKIEDDATFGRRRSSALRGNVEPIRALSQDIRVSSARRAARMLCRSKGFV